MSEAYQMRGRTFSAFRGRFVNIATRHRQIRNATGRMGRKAPAEQIPIRTDNRHVDLLRIGVRCGDRQIVCADAPGTDWHMHLIL